MKTISWRPRNIPAKSVAVVVINKENKVLLHQREDFRIWTLPGGNIEAGESWQSAAVREAYEETGYRIEVDRLVGEYWQPQMPNGGLTKYVCAGRVIGGSSHSKTQIMPKWQAIAIKYLLKVRDLRNRILNHP